MKKIAVSFSKNISLFEFRFRLGAEARMHPEAKRRLWEHYSPDSRVTHEQRQSAVTPSLVLESMAVA